ncbi:MAG: T9SS type A sorting domain-containing protein [Moheibacter sp.]
MKKRLTILLLLVFVLGGFVYSQSFILVNDSSVRKVHKLSAEDGAVIHSNFIDLVEVAAGTVKSIIQVNSEIWFGDQLNDKIYRYDLDGNFLSELYGSELGFDRMRGMNIVNGEVWLTNGGADNGVPQHTIIRLDTSGNFIGFHPTVNEPFDVVDGGNGLVYISSYSGSGIGVMNYEGISQENLVPSGVFTTLQQMNLTPEGNLLVAVYLTNTGLYEISTEDGSLIDYYGVPELRGTIAIGNGNYLVSSNNGVISVDPSTGNTTPIISGIFQYLGLIDSDMNTTDVKLTDISIYPNPTNGVFQLNSQDLIQNVSIFNVNGKKLKQFTENSKNVELAITDLPSGLYILKVQTQKGVKSLKLIKK